ncbi:MAG: GNAT family N-acetyltransferase [Eubacterium sp.]|nr:GNAT family N-acetyltransferase [Eubacterium sp.]
MIREMKREEIPECVAIIRKSFQTVADQFGFTEENCPRFTAFATNVDRLNYWVDKEHRGMFVFEDEGVLCGFFSLLYQEGNECELGSLSVLPEHRHKGIGRMFLDHACKVAREKNIERINISIVEENQVLRRWYESYGAIHIGTKKFDFFPFTSGYMKIEL